MRSKLIVINSPTSTGSQAITGVGFKPKAIILFTANINADGNTPDQQIAIGVGTAATERWTSGVAANDGANGAARVFNTDEILSVVNHAATLQLEADLTSLDADGFTLNWTTVQGTTRQIFVLCLGGPDITAKAGSYDTAASTGNQAVTGVGFKPEVVLFGNSLDDATEPGSLYYWFNIGVAKSSSSRGALSAGQSNDTSTLQSKSSLITTKIVWDIYAGTTYTETDFVSNDSDGFTVNHTVVTQKPRVGYLALRGVKATIGTFDENTTTGNQSITGLPFRPEALLFLSRSKASGTTSTAPASLSIGGATSSSNRGAIATDASEAIGRVADRSSESDKCLTHLTAGTPTTNAEADFVSNNGNGFTINMTTADAKARTVLYLALASRLRDPIGGSDLIPTPRK